MIPVKLESLSISNVGFVVMLKSENGPKSLPVFIGLPEAQSIALFVNNVSVPRPMTHDLLKNVLDVLEGRLDHVEVYDLREGTFYGRLALTFEGRQLGVDTRPSDAVALALRCQAPIFVAEKVMEEAGVVVESVADGEETGAPPPEPANKMDRLRAQLEQAVTEERYEEAAELRDQIRREQHAPASDGNEQDEDST